MLGQHLAALPHEYREFLQGSNGATGIGPNLFVVLWPTEELLDVNREYGSEEFADGLFLVGSDGCGNLIGVDTRSGDANQMPFVWFDAICMSWSAIRHRSNSFAELLDFL